METRTDKITNQPMTAPTPAPAPARRRLHPAAVRLFLVALLFLGWIGYLVYLVATRPLLPEGVPLVLSRPQFLISDLDVIAEVNDTGPDAEVVVKEILYPRAGADVEVGQKARVVNLGACRLLPSDGEKMPPGPGLYLLPLQHLPDGTYQVAAPPPSPGFPPTINKPAPRVYPLNDPTLKRAALAQYATIKKP